MAKAFLSISFFAAGLASLCSAQGRLMVRAPHGDQLGASIAAAGDVDGDGVPDLIVGAPQPAIEQPGYAAIFSGRDGRLLRRMNGRSAGDFLGFAVDGGKDVDGDGRPDCVVSALNWNRHTLNWDRNSEEGPPSYAVVYSGADGSPIHELETPAGAELFGNAVLLLGDLDGDGKSEIAVAAPAHGFHSGSGHGKVFVHSGATGAVLYEVSATHPRDRFAQSIALAGDLDEDGVPDFVVGAPGDHAPDGLQCYVRAVSGKSGETIFVLDAEERRAGFGFAVAGGADFDGDGRPDIAVGSMLDSVLPPDALRVISSVTRAPILRIPTEPRTHRPAFSIAFAGDLDGDGACELLVSNPFAPDSALRIYDRSGAYQSVAGTPPNPEGGVRVCVLGDVDDDGVNDFAVACHWATFEAPPDYATVGAVTVFSGKTRTPLYTIRGEVQPAPASQEDPAEEGSDETGRSKTSS